MAFISPNMRAAMAQNARRVVPQGLQPAPGGVTRLPSTRPGNMQPPPPMGGQMPPQKPAAGQMGGAMPPQGYRPPVMGPPNQQIMPPGQGTPQNSQIALANALRNRQ